MRRIDALGITFGFFIFGGVAYLGLQLFGIDSIQAGIWTQALLVTILIGWLLTYIFRVQTKTMTYNQQVKNYEDAFFQRQWENLTPEEREKLQTEFERDQISKSDQNT